MSAALIAVMAKHLPPSGAALRLVDVDGQAAAVLADLRPDLDIQTPALADWQPAASSVDAVTAFAVKPTDALFQTACDALRPGGRLILIDPDGQSEEAQVQRLAAAGLTRILVEPALAGAGVLLRGEKPHTAARTVERIRQVADADTLPGRYVHLLVRQMPNKPVWALRPDEAITWQAAALATPDGPVLLAFSSLPKAVAFMQPAVMQGWISDINKVAKFSKALAADWSLTVNPDFASLAGQVVTLVTVDPALAEAPDE